METFRNTGGLAGRDILQAEYMNINNQDLLIVRTKDKILALYEEASEAHPQGTEVLSSWDLQSIIHPMQRGYADSIYWIEEMGKKRNHLMGVRFEE